MKKLYILYYLLFILFTGCIENDIPYPYIELKVLSISVEGQQSVRIDNDARTVTIELDEATDIRKVKIESLELTDGATTTIGVNSVLDLTSPVTITLTQYQSYEWTLVAVQNIERYFNVEGQIGKSVISVGSCKAIAYVSTQSDLSNIIVTKLKLGPEGATITPTISELKNFSNPLNTCKVEVSYFDIKETWSLYVLTTDIVVETSAVYPWAKQARLVGLCKAGAVGGFEYCLNDGNDEWLSVNPSLIEQNGTTFQVQLTGLNAGTSYRCRAFVGEDYGAILDFTTSDATPLPNGTMDFWWKDGKVWNPWSEGDENFWDTGNAGATTLGDSNTEPTNTEKWDKKNNGYAAKLSSKFVGIGAVGKFAAGNIYVGDFREVDGTNGIIDMGKPFTTFPTRLTGYYKYKGVPMDYVTSETEHMRGQPDTCSIYIALGDWDSPVEIRTRPSKRKLFDVTDPHIIAYADFYSAESTTNYEKFTLNLAYRELGRTPKYILIVCSASKYGDYFTGGSGSTMWIDELTLEYD